MYVFDPVISAGSGGESTLHLRDEPVLSLIEAVGARRSRFNQQESAEQSFLEFKGSIPARDAPTHGSSTRQCQPHHATNSGAERLNGHSCQRDTAISPRIQFSPACPISSEESATYSPALVTHAFRRSDSRPEDSGDVQPLASYHKIEAFAATTSEVAGLLSGFDVNLSPRPPGVIERTQGSRQIEDPTSIFSFLRTKSTKNATHGEGVLGKGKLVASFMEGFRTMYDRGFVSTTANPETASSSAVSEPERNASEPSSTTSYPQKEKRPRVDQSDHDADSDEDKNRKRSRTPKKDVPPGKNDCQKFACPYRKHNPRKYNVQSWRTCALTPHENVARVK
ncbi:hypothetical protein IFR04_015747 [Cadophora malorum]|uniref:Uncharacterized protein n=1 Tax=Cadophora malorum TaxID=108018 RepID=A0A8H7T2H6_9HELO|nr:hypothetical protein IFR04_015747 [Cadophora malorum]